MGISARCSGADGGGDESMTRLREAGIIAISVVPSWQCFDGRDVSVALAEVAPAVRLTFEFGAIDG
jgi:hypothetical protein